MPVVAVHSLPAVQLVSVPIIPIFPVAIVPIPVATIVAILFPRRACIGLRVDAAICIGAAGAGHALGVAGELAIAGIPPLASLQAVTILRRSRTNGSDDSESGNS